MAANQPQKEVHRLDFFRPDQIVFLVTHKPTINEQLPDVPLAQWVENLILQMREQEGLSARPARDYVGELCEQLNDDEHLPQKQLNEWTENLKGLLGQFGEQSWRVVDPQPRSYSFPLVNSDEVGDVPSDYRQELFPDKSFSIIACNVEEISPTGANDPGTNNKADLAKVNEKRLGTREHLLTLISTLDEAGPRKLLSTPDLIVEAITPNWIVSGAKSDSGGTGGPGGEPVPFTDTDIATQIPYYFKDLIDKLGNKGEYEDPKGIDLYSKGKGVDVVILDTAPSGDDLVLAYKELVSRKDMGKEHPIVKSLMETDGLLNLHSATLEERRRMGNTSLNKQGYKMADHGLFIAGIINSIVPEATIHLVEVLNQFGVGDIETISRGFARAYAIYRKNKRPLVVNCSLCLDLPDLVDEFAYRETKEELIASTEKDFEKALRKQLQQEMAEIIKHHPTESKRWQDDVRWVVELRVMCERLGRIGRQVVAAAGNDSKPRAGGQRHAQSARYPAAFTKVIGVGALNSQAKPSKYSNLADKPAQNGIMAFGGERYPGKGVLGLYLGEFPEVISSTDDDENDNDQAIQAVAAPKIIENGWAQVPSNNKLGWARWAGTSFATPILTATIASVLSAPSPSSTTQDAVGKLYGAKVILNQFTTEAEDGMLMSIKQDINPNL